MAACRATTLVGLLAHTATVQVLCVCYWFRSGGVYGLHVGVLAMCLCTHHLYHVCLMLLVMPFAADGLCLCTCLLPMPSMWHTSTRLSSAHQHKHTSGKSLARSRSRCCALQSPTLDSSWTQLQRAPARTPAPCGASVCAGGGEWLLVLFSSTNHIFDGLA